MTVGSFIVRNTFRNKRRSLLTMISIGFSLLLLTMMICIWRAFYVDQVAPEAARRLIIRDKVSLAFFLPSYYRDKIRAVPGITAVAPLTWFEGRYIDNRPEHFFARLATDPDEYLKVANDKIVPPDQVKAWQQDRAGALVDETLVQKYGWKLGDRIHLQGTIFPVDLDLTIRAIYHRDPPQNALYFNTKYLEEAVPWMKGQAGWYGAQVDSADHVASAAHEIDDMFRNSPLPTKSESEKAFQLGFVASLGNVKAFILGICGAVMFAIMLVSANTMAMSVRSRTREVAVLKTLGFTSQRVLSIFVSESIALSVAGGLLGILVAIPVISGITHQFLGLGIPLDMKVRPPAALFALLIAVLLGVVSGCLPAYRASRMNIVEGLRHIG
ncbi:MAG TPA: FtsX-like permease family protein [Verrucomicrobiae bacterium]|jgi:putative ABC transport system permease protein|nr:FtsX-like permease family protein [Verrucomicrobiae bacterium]